MAARLLCILALVVLTSISARADVETELNAGFNSFYQERFEEASNHFGRALQEDPLSSLALWMHLDTGRRVKTINKIVDTLEARVRSNPNSAPFRAQLGLAYMFQSETRPSATNNGAEQFKRAMELDPNCSVVHGALGLYYFTTDKKAKARNYLQRAVEINRSDFMAAERLGEILLIDDDKAEQALPVFKALTKSLPIHADTWFFLGFTLEKLKAKKGTQEAYEESIRLDPRALTRSAFARLRLAKIHVHGKRNQQAVALLQELVQLRPDIQEAREELDGLVKPK